MIKTRTVAAAAAGAVGAGVLGAGAFTLPAGAQATLGPWSVAPGESFTVSGGDPCLPDDPDADPAPEMTVTITIDEPAITPDVTGVSVDADGSWSATVTVAAEEAPGTYNVGTRCLADGVPTAAPDLGSGVLTVDEGTTTTESSTTSTTPGSEPPTPTTSPDGDGDEGPDDEGPDGGDGEAPPSGDGEDGDDDEDEGPQPGEPAPPVNGDADYTG